VQPVHEVNLESTRRAEHSFVAFGPPLAA
jgi:hypothetical protein